MITIVLCALAALAVWFSFFLGRDFFKHKKSLENVSWLKTGVIGFVVNFFDTLGVGAFAPQTALLKFTRQTKDKQIPGTLNVANTLPTLAEAIIFIKIIEVDITTLIVMVLAAMFGAIIGAGMVAKFSESKVRLTMGIALLVTASFMLANKFNLIQGSGSETGLTGAKLVIAGAVNFILGALMTAGIGLYAPCMALVFALGLSPKVAFPIMMGSCAFLMPPASYKFIKAAAYNRKAAVGMAIPGIVGVLLAAFIVKSLPLDIFRWIVIVVILYTSATMLFAYFKKNSS